MHPRDGKSTDPLSNVTLDDDRQRRCGFPEVIFGEGKSVDALREIISVLLRKEQDVFVTRVVPQTAYDLTKSFPAARYTAVARTFRVPRSQSAIRNPESEIPFVAVITAGTSDLPVAEEARETLEWMGVATVMIHDVGVAGPHRLPAHLHELRKLDAAVVVAGMEGALPSVVGGYVD